VLLIIFLGLIAKLALVSGDCGAQNLTLNYFVWTNMCITVLIRFLLQVAVKFSPCLDISIAELSLGPITRFIFIN
jgi:hypothetical protein